MENNHLWTFNVTRKPVVECTRHRVLIPTLEWRFRGNRFL